jgi:hypothetical protein
MRDEDRDDLPCEVDPIGRGGRAVKGASDQKRKEHRDAG